MGLVIPTWGLSPPCPPPYFSPAWAQWFGFWWCCNSAVLLFPPVLCCCGLMPWAVPVPREVAEECGVCLFPALLRFWLLRSCPHWRSLPALQDYMMPGLLQVNFTEEEMPHSSQFSFTSLLWCQDVQQRLSLEAFQTREVFDPGVSSLAGLFAHICMCSWCRFSDFWPKEVNTEILIGHHIS